MVLTMQSAYDEIENTPKFRVGEVANDLAQGALMGARGNSGVILSQLWRGFARALDGQDVINGQTLANAFATARDTAYKGVVRPVEGTILTVAKDIAAAAKAALAITSDPFEILEIVVEAADASVEYTPELLDVLKDAGVVEGEGMLRFSKGMSLDTAVATVQPLSAIKLEGAMQTVEPGQDYEVVIDFRPDKPLVLEKYFGALEEMGTSIQIGEGDGMYRMHIHVPTEKRYEPIDYTT